MSKSKKQSNNPASFSDLYEKIAGPNSIVSIVITGHLTIEFLLRTLISQYDKKLTSLSDDLNHGKLITLCRDIEILSPEQAAVLSQINQLRNKIAHQITYTPSIEELVNLFSAASKAFHDISDGIVQGLEELNTAQSIQDLEDWVLPELFIQILYDLHFYYIDAGGDHEYFQYQQ